jgi:hypothetical protein
MYYSITYLSFFLAIVPSVVAEWPKPKETAEEAHPVGDVVPWPRQENSKRAA